MNTSPRRNFLEGAVSFKNEKIYIAYNKNFLKEDE